jgi:outer membrane lipoprotein-sorting protein
MIKALILLLVCNISTAATLTALEIIQKEEAQTFGKTLQARMKMTIDSEGNSRTLEYKLWMEGQEKTSIKIIKPEKDKNLGNLKIGLQLWQFLPKVDRIIKIPPSMMLQSWMGSDFSNDDLVKGSKLSKDYVLKFTGMGEVNGIKAYVIEATPKPNAPIVWGKVIEYVSQSDFAALKREMYSEKGQLIKTMIGSKIKQYNGHSTASHLTMINHEKNNRKTVIEYLEATYDRPIDSKLFSQEYLRKPVF